MHLKQQIFRCFSRKNTGVTHYIDDIVNAGSLVWLTGRLNGTEPSLTLNVCCEKGLFTSKWLWIGNPLDMNRRVASMNGFGHALLLDDAVSNMRTNEGILEEVQSVPKRKEE